MLALQSLTPVALERAVPGLSAAEARKIVSAVQRDLWARDGASQGRFVGAGALAGVRRWSLEAVRRLGHVPELAVVGEHASAIDPFVKLVLRTHDGHLIETVRIPLERPDRASVCVSSQVGCALACAFCATGRMGLTRNLETWEIVEQVRLVKRSLAKLTPAARPGRRVHGVVFQGMGEPLANLDRVLESIFVMCDPSALAIDARAITVCTAGLPSGIRRLAKEAPRVRLAISIGSARTETRRTLMPIERANPLAEVLEAAAEHARTTGLAPMWAVTPLAGVNDGADDGRAIAELAVAFARSTGVRPRISVIPYNPIAETDDPFARTSPEREAEFRAALRAGGYPTHKRYSGGSDVNAACGQLAARPIA